MANDQIDSESDILSAYLDNQLPSETRQALDARLEREPALRADLRDLEATITLLKQLEPVQPPRSFTLDPAAVRPRPSIWQLPATWMRLGSAFAVLLLTLTVALNGAGLQSNVGGAAPGEAASESADVAVAAATSAPAAAQQNPPAPAAAPSVADSESATAANSATRSVLVPTDAASQPGPLTASGEISDPKSSSPGTTSLNTYQSEPPNEVAQPRRSLSPLQIALGALALALFAGSFLIRRVR